MINMLCWIFWGCKQIKNWIDLATPTTGIPESVSSESASITEANLDELSKLITLDIQSSILDCLEQYEKPNLEAIEKLLKWNCQIQ